MAAPVKEDKPKTVKKKTTKKKTKKKAAKVVKKETPQEEKGLAVKINEALLNQVRELQKRFGLANETEVLVRGLAVLKEWDRRRAEYDLCFIERKTKKVVLITIGEPKDAGGS